MNPNRSDTPAAGAPPAARHSDARTITLVGLAHGSSHFCHLLLPPLFPIFIRDFGVTYAELGLAVTLFFAISGIGQALSGFIVDRIGARPILFGALGCFIAAALTAAMAHGYAGLLLASALAGLGNAPFHPVDFTILNKRVSSPRLGHAFSVHGISGNLGWAAAPVFLLGLTELTGSWRWAQLGAAGVVGAVLLLLWWQREAIDDRLGAWSHEKAANKPGAAPVKEEHPLAFLKLSSVWLCFSFFFFSTCALSAIQSFASPALQQMTGLPVATTSLVVTGFMLCSAAGMVAGGFLVARAQRLEKTIAVCLVIAAALLLLVSSGVVGGMAALVLVSAAGVGVGVAGPSRDMLIKRASPPGATGRVYGTVYSGLDLGFALAAPAFGWLMDHGHDAGIFQGSALALLAGVVSAAAVGLRVTPRRTATGAAA
ncbi:MFS transporter [Azohydromonas caseinilytica]|uniref:MFS transporter n=1 Tax=Azohydromonas caseinilytica TaxID=2728836 RepID=A0A848FEI6_9BURK|nr:MFS transporter [Azohydromonas caseinilytica]NML17476.1 MFS transporter [Azohydromonas caseinilytica]